MDKNFKGFSFDKERLTPIPASFFTHALQSVENLAQLKIILYILWWHSRCEATPPYITFKSFTKDEVFMSGIGNNKSSQLKSLKHGLQLAVEQNILLAASVTIGEKKEEIFLLNTSEGQSAF